MSDAADLLQQLGFGEYEARAYIALLQKSPVNGYELAKQSGIPRANIYDILRRLEQRNAVIAIEEAGSTHYAPVPPNQLLPQMKLQLSGVIADAERSLEALAAPAQAALSRNILGYASLLDQARTFINAAEQELIIALWHPEAEMLTMEMANAQQRGVRLTTLCLQACPADCSGCKGAIYRYRITHEHIARWFIVIRDNAEMLLGEIGEDQSIAIRTGQGSLVQMTKQYILSNLAWAALLNNTDSSFDRALPSEAQRMLHQIGPAESQLGWLSYMRDLLQSGHS